MRAMHILIIIKVCIAYKAFRILPTKRKYFIHAATDRGKTRYHLHARCSHARYYCGHLLFRTGVGHATAGIVWTANRSIQHRNWLDDGILSSLGDLPALLPVLSCYYLDWHGTSILLTKKCQMWRNLLLPKLRLKRRPLSDERYFRQV